MQPTPGRPARVSKPVEHSRPGRVTLVPGSWIDYDPAWLDADSANSLFARLKVQVAWQERTIELFGRRVLQPRLVAWVGSMAYRYSGQTLEPAPVPRFLQRLFRALEELTHVRFNHLLMNRYRSGDDYMGWHSDDEPELGDDPPIASLSLGAIRRFVIKPKRPRHGSAHRWQLESGSLMVMGGSTQHHFRHGVPRQKTVQEERINLTFRRILRAPEKRPLAG